MKTIFKIPIAFQDTGCFFSKGLSVCFLKCQLPIKGVTISILQRFFKFNVSIKVSPIYPVSQSQNSGSLLFLPVFTTCAQMITNGTASLHFCSVTTKLNHFLVFTSQPLQPPPGRVHAFAPGTPIYSPAATARMSLLKCKSEVERN